MIYALSLIPIALLVFALVDAIITSESDMKHLPKFGWILLIVILPLAGSIAWIIAGKERRMPAPRVQQQPHVEREETSTETDEERIEREIAFHENEFRIRRLEEELRRKQQDSTRDVPDSHA